MEQGSVPKASDGTDGGSTDGERQNSHYSVNKCTACKLQLFGNLDIAK